MLVYITANSLKVKEGHIGITAEKTETVEFKLAMGQLVKLGQFTEARQLFYDFLKIRPDIQLDLSDVSNEIPDIELILFILEREKELGIVGMYEVSHDLRDLIQHLRKTREILLNEKKQKTENNLEEQYLSDKKVSEIMRNVIMANI